MSTVLADPAKMIATGAPHVIHNDEELETYTSALFQLTALENPSRSEAEAIELLTLLIERYEETHYAIPAADAVSVVRFLLEHQPHPARSDTAIRIGKRRLHVSREATEAHGGPGPETERTFQTSC
ncbi:MAG TPA: hypothetical protein VGF61_20400 [Candidatus Acidoferrum sp.]|jgi:antitoxin component HigA of HigAB toxin-antitoxin module